MTQSTVTADPGEAEVLCPTCDGTGQCLMRGDSHETYDDPDYWDRCGICGGIGWLPASMFAVTPDDDYEDEL